MQDELMRLLERIEAEPHIKVSKLINEGEPNENDKVERRRIINDAYHSGLIVETTNPNPSVERYTTVPENMECFLTIVFCVKY